MSSPWSFRCDGERTSTSCSWRPARCFSPSGESGYFTNAAARVFRRVSDAFSHPWGRPLPFLSFFCSSLFSPFSSTHSLSRLTLNLFLAGYLESANNCTIVTWHEIPVWKPPVFHSLSCSSSVFSPSSQRVRCEVKCWCLSGKQCRNFTLSPCESMKKRVKVSLCRHPSWV